MVAATITQTALTPPLTTPGIANAIATAMQSAGFTLINTVSGATETRAFSYVVNGAVTKGTVFLKLDVTTTTIAYAMADNYTIGTNTMVNSITGGSFSLSPVASLSLVAVNHPELRLVYLTNATSIGAIGYARPATKYSWWDENSFLYAFLPSITIPARLLTLPLSSIPIAAAGYALTERLDVSPPSGGAQLIRSPFLIGATASKSAFGQFSSDIVCVPGAGQSLLTSFESGSEQFNLILASPSDFVALAVKV
jgi:hypothetical protein